MATLKRIWRESNGITYRAIIDLGNGREIEMVEIYNTPRGYLTSKEEKIQEYRNTHHFVGGRCWHCQIKPDYLTEYLFAFLNGNIDEKTLRSISPCHEKILVDGEAIVPSEVTKIQDRCGKELNFKKWKQGGSVKCIEGRISITTYPRPDQTATFLTVRDLCDGCEKHDRS